MKKQWCALYVRYIRKDHNLNDNNKYTYTALCYNAGYVSIRCIVLCSNTSHVGPAG